MEFKYYVLNESMYRNREICFYNVFDNGWVNSQTEKEVRRYLRAPKKYKRKWEWDRESQSLTGFPAFVRELTSIIGCEEHFRCEYEILVESMFGGDVRGVVKKFDEYATKEDFLDAIKKELAKERVYKIDCFMQCERNMEMIAREVIYQAKQQLKEKKGEV